jgi:hypothetical protein
MTHDWTKPLETDEAEPKPVRVLASDFKGHRCPYMCAIDCGDFETYSLFDANGWSNDHSVRLRNIKPKPVLREAWLNLYSDPKIHPTMQTTKRGADDVAREGRVECRRIAWMSDGSPVDQEHHDSLEWDELRSEVEAMREVVDAAKAWRDWYKRNFVTNIEAVTNLVDAIEAHEEKTDDLT